MKEKSVWFFLVLVFWAVSGYAKTFEAGPDFPGGLDGVRNAVRKMSKDEPVEVILAPGLWRVETPLELIAEDSGTAENPVVWRGTKDETVLTGGKPISPDLFHTPGTEILDRLDPAFREAIFEINLNEAGIEPLPPTGTKSKLPMEIPELFFGGKRMKIAQWPNDGWSRIKTILNDGISANEADPSRKTGGTFEYDASEENRPARWLNAPSVLLHGYWCFDWSSEVIRTASIDAETNLITLADKHNYGLRQGNPSPRRWMAVNLPEEIDQPGEYAYESETNRIWFYPPASIDSEPIMIAARNNPVIRLQDASYLTISGITVDGSYDSAIEVLNGNCITVDNCAFRNTRGCGVVIAGGKENRVLNSLIEETGSGGIKASGGDRKNLEPCGFLFENNIIRRFSVHLLCYANGLAMTGVGMTARHNEFYDAPHQAVAMNTNDSVFEYNTVHDVCLTGDDCGALYKGRNPSMRGNIIRYNYWYDIGSPRGHGCAAIYFDDGDGGDSVIGNFFLRCGDPGIGAFGTVFSHGGHGILVEGNTFVDCKRPLGSAPWDDQRWKDYIDAELWQKRLLQEVDITSSVYTERYPELIGFMDGAPAEERKSWAKNNVFIRPTEEPTGNWDVDETNLTRDRE